MVGVSLRTPHGSVGNDNPGKDYDSSNGADDKPSDVAKCLGQKWLVEETCRKLSSE